MKSIVFALPLLFFSGATTVTVACRTLADGTREPDYALIRELALGAANEFRLEYEKGGDPKYLRYALAAEAVAHTIEDDHALAAAIEGLLALAGDDLKPEIRIPLRIALAGLRAQ